MEIRLVDGRSFDAYVARPDRKVAPGLVILQEIFGVTPSLRAAADYWAANGFFAIVPDLYWRHEKGIVLAENDEASRERGRALAQGTNTALTLQDIDAAVHHLRRSEGCDGSVGAIGFCFGGKLAFLAACDGLVDAAVGYYPTAIHTVLDEAVRLERPTALHIAEQDALCPPEAQQLVSKHLLPNRHVTLYTHLGVGHAFARIGGDTYDSGAAIQANRATLTFLRKHLRPA